MPGWNYPHRLIDDGKAQQNFDALKVWADTKFGNAEPINVKDYGATGDGVTDDTDAITAAWADTVGRGAAIFFPGGTYIFNGPALTFTESGQSVSITGVGAKETTIQLGSGDLLFDTLFGFDWFHLADMTIRGGYGAVRAQTTGQNVLGIRTFVRVDFKDYTGCAVSNSSSDSPYWMFTNCRFHGLDYGTTMGIACSGLTDGVSIKDCDFQRNRVSIKLGDGGNNAYIDSCAFLRWSTTRVSSNPAIDVWAVPNDSTTNAGAGLTVRSSKFGNENFASGDYKVVYADEGSGTLFGDRFPSLSADSTGYVYGHTFADNHVVGNANSSPFIYSTTPNVVSLRVSAIVGGSKPTYWLQFRTVPGPDRLNSDNILGPITGPALGTESITTIPASNGDGVFRVMDPSAIFATQPNELNPYSAGEPIDYVALLPTALTAFTRLATVTGAGTTDAYGGTDAVTVDALDTTGIYAALTTASIEVGRPAWVEFDLLTYGASPLTSLYAQLQYTSSGAFHWRRIVNVPSGWRRYRFPVTLREKSTSVLLMFATTSGTGSVKIGRAKMYHAREPINVDGKVLDLGHTGTLAGFYNTQPIAKPTVSGSRGGNAALADLLTELANLGLIVDTTS
jgi:hypothetical protein